MEVLSEDIKDLAHFKNMYKMNEELMQAERQRYHDLTKEL